MISRSYIVHTFEFCGPNGNFEIGKKYQLNEYCFRIRMQRWKKEVPGLRTDASLQSEKYWFYFIQTKHDISDFFLRFPFLISPSFSVLIFWLWLSAFRFGMHTFRSWHGVVQHVVHATYHSCYYWWVRAIYTIELLIPTYARSKNDQCDPLWRSSASAIE